MSSLRAGDPFDSGPGFDLDSSELSSLWAWLTAGLSLVALGVAVVGRLFPPVLGLDLIALWPIPAVAVVVALVAQLRRSGGFLRISAPLLLVSWLILGVGWWSAGSPMPPSHAANVVGPVDVPGQVTVAFSLPGALRITSGSSAVYEVSLGRRGGFVGAPDILEARQDGVMAMTVNERTDSGWYRASGWDVLLHSDPLWKLDIEANSVDLDLRSLEVTHLELSGDGTVLLGEPSGVVEVLLTGSLTVSIPVGTPATIIGDAEVPIRWLSTEDGWRSPSDGDGYLITTGVGQEIVVVDR